MRRRSPCAASMPSSASLTTASGALMSFFIVWCSTAMGKPFSAGEEEVEGQRAEDAADDRADHRDPGVAPVGIALAGDRQDGVHDARPEVAGRVDRVARWSAQREPDGEHQE